MVVTTNINHILFIVEFTEPIIINSVTCVLTLCDAFIYGAWVWNEIMKTSNGKESMWLINFERTNLKYCTFYLHNIYEIYF